MKLQCIVPILFLLAVACKNSDKYVTTVEDRGIETTTIDFTKVQAGRDSIVHYSSLPLSEIADDIQVIRLETGDKCLVDGEATYWVGDSCIIVVQRDQIMMFDREGRFRRTIATSGRAPEEFGKFQDVRIKNGKIYLLDDFGKGKIFSLKEGEGVSNFQGCTEDRFYNSFLPLDNGHILMAPFKCEGSKNIYYVQDTAGKFQEGVSCPPNKEILCYNGRKLVSQVGQEYRYTPFTVDTVFQIIHGSLLPRWIFKVGAQQEIEVHGETSRFLFLNLRMITNQSTSNSVVYTTYSNAYYCYDKEAKKLSAFNDIFDDRFASVRRDIQNLRIQDGEWFYWVYPASMLTEAIPLILESEEVDDKIKEHMKDLQGTITLDDNPVILIGRLK